ncbi:MAG TPA: hypothetical protein VIC84_00140, partial [Blastocatellia bacterium]
MRRLTIAALSTFILLCAPVSSHQSRESHSIGWTPLMTNLLWIVAPPAQASVNERGAALSAQESISLEPGKPVERELSGGQAHSYKITTVSGQYLHI